MRTLSVVLGLLAFLAAGCGAVEKPASGGVLTVQEALDSGARGPVTVRGFVFADDVWTHLCNASAESYPPQCGEPSIRVEGLTLADVPGLHGDRYQLWTDSELVLEGDLEGTVLRVERIAPTRRRE